MTGGDAALPPLLDFIPQVTPGYERPEHLAPILTRLEHCDEHRIDDATSTPPRHGKTEGILHYIVHALKKNPRDSLAYFTYNYNQAHRKAKDALDIADRAGLRLKQGGVEEWRTPEGGKVYWGGVRGSFTGVGVRVLIIDDPHKDRLEAESQVIRNHTWEWFTDTAYSRIEPGGSCMVNMARWHVDDLIGMLVKPKVREKMKVERGTAFRHLNLPAINAQGQALWPSRWPVEELRRKKWNEYTWASLYMGTPIARGGAIFANAFSYNRSVLPQEGYRWGMGLDFAYTKSTHSDYSVIIKGVLYQGRIYVTGMKRVQVPMRQFLPMIRYWAEPGMLVRAYIGGGAETYVGEQVQEKLPDVDVEIVPTTTDKFTRAMPASEAWAQGHIMLPDGPDDAEWVGELLEEVNSFTGVDDTHDDIVDGLVALHDVAKSGGTGYDGLDGKGLGGRRM